MGGGENHVAIQGNAWIYFEKFVSYKLIFKKSIYF